MANYKVNPDKKTVIVNGALSAIEKSIIATYIGEGYTVKEARKDTAKRIDNDIIIAYFDANKDEEGKKKFEAEKAKKIKDKNGKERKAGFLCALKWFRANYAEAYKAIREELKAKK